MGGPVLYLDLGSPYAYLALARAETVFGEPVKAALRSATDAAWDAGVRGIPTVRVADQLFYGDDQLERAALAT